MLETGTAPVRCQIGRVVQSGSVQTTVVNEAHAFGLLVGPPLSLQQRLLDVDRTVQDYWVEIIPQHLRDFYSILQLSYSLFIPGCLLLILLIELSHFADQRVYLVEHCNYFIPISAPVALDFPNSISEVVGFYLFSQLLSSSILFRLLIEPLLISFFKVFE